MDTGNVRFKTGITPDTCFPNVSKKKQLKMIRSSLINLTEEEVWRADMCVEWPEIHISTSFTVRFSKEIDPKLCVFFLSIMTESDTLTADMHF